MPLIRIPVRQAILVADRKYGFRLILCDEHEVVDTRLLSTPAAARKAVEELCTGDLEHPLHVHETFMLLPLPEVPMTRATSDLSQSPSEPQT